MPGRSDEATGCAEVDGTARLDTLRRTGLLDTPPEAAFDRLTRLARRVLGVPVALISLVDADRQFFKSQQGLPEPWASLRETPLSHSFCRHIVAADTPLVVPDAREHPLVSRNPAIKEIGVTAYLGVPLKAPDGQILGAFCVIDTAPRAWTEEDVGQLRDLADVAGGEITLRLELAGRARAERRLATEHAVAHALAEARDIAEAAPLMLERLCATLEVEVGELWLPSPDRTHLACVAFHAAVPDAEAFRHATLAIRAERGAGLPGRVWATSEAAWITDVGRDPSLPRSQVAAAAGLNTGFGFPLLLDGACAGALCFSSRQLLPRDEALLVMMTSVGRSIGEFIKRSSAEAALRERNAALEALNRFSVAISGELDRDRLVQRVVDDATSLVGAAFGAFFHDIAAEGEDGFGLYTLSGAPPDAFARFPRLRATPVFGPTFSGAGLVRSDDITLDPRYGHNTPHCGMPEGHLPVRSYLAAPVVSRSGKVAGALIFGHPAPGVFGELAERLVVGVAAQAAVAIENAELYRAAQREIEERKRAEQAGQAKADFLAAMSHEIRTPLTAVLGMADILAAANLPGKEKEHVEAIRTSGRHLLAIINDVLDYSRIEAGGLALERVDFSLAQVLEQVRSLMAPQAAERGLNLHFSYNGYLPPTVRGDPTRLEQVLLNLVGNGLKFTHAGEVEVWLASSPEGDGRYRLRFEVRDTGIGMTEAQIAGLFRPFAQADRSTTRRYGGSGLGLAISWRLVEAMGGRIGVESTAGVGSLFWFEVPLERGDAVVAAERLPFDPASVPPARILIAEDARVNRELLWEMLTRHGHEVAFAKNGAEAVELATRERFDLVLMDARMPVMDGVEATRRIRRLPPPACDVPIVALTANVMATERERYLAAGMDGCLAKPIDWGQLFGVIARCVSDGSLAHSEDRERKDEPLGAALLDRAVLDRLVADLPPEALAGLLRDGLGELEGARARLAALPSGELAEEAHKLAGVAAFLGLATVRSALAELQAAARERRSVADLLARLEAVTGETRAELRRAGLLG